MLGRSVVYSIGVVSVLSVLGGGFLCSSVQQHLLHSCGINLLFYLGVNVVK